MASHGTVKRIRQLLLHTGRCMSVVIIAGVLMRRDHGCGDVTFCSLSHRRLQHTLHKTRPVCPAVVKRLPSAGFVAAAPRRRFNQFKRPHPLQIYAVSYTSSCKINMVPFYMHRTPSIPCIPSPRSCYCDHPVNSTVLQYQELDSRC